MVGGEELQVDVLFVGGGSASLSGALHLLNLIEKHNQTQAVKLEDITVAVLEKGSSLGAHILSGAVLDPVALQELIPDFLEKGCPLEGPVMEDQVHFLTRNSQIKLPFIPPTMRNHGNYICTLGKFVQWLGGQVEEKGGLIFTQTVAESLIEVDETIAGVTTGDKGIDRDHRKKPNFERGIRINSKVVVLGEGPLGTVTRKAIERFKLQEGKSPQVYATSVKEVWEVPPGRIPEGTVIHTMGYPLPDDMFGGGFLYALKDHKISVGLVVALDYKDPYFDTQAVFQTYKQHPLIRSILQDGKIQRYGAKVIPEGGYFAIPKLSFPGGLIIGDSAGLVNVPKLKGIHYGMKSGMLAAETIYEALVHNDFSPERFAAYEKKVMDSYIGKDLYRTRYFKSAFHGSFKFGLIKFGLQMALGGWWFTKGPVREDRWGMQFVHQYHPSEIEPPVVQADEKFTFKKLTDLYYSGTKHEENQPVHLLVNHFKFGDSDICATRCKEEFGNPCQYFCPASVYEMETEAGTGKLQLKINASNCVHCKTCDIKDPYGVIEWVSPEGGGGPSYLQM